MMPRFKIIKKDKGSKARAGIIKTSHGDILTPAFIPVGTKATVKSLNSVQLKEIGLQAILANTYHLHLQPGEETIKKLGGLAKFMDWKRDYSRYTNISAVNEFGPTMTDSGGFQVFSLGVGLEKPGVKFLKDLDHGRLKIEDGSSINHQTPILKNPSSTVYPLSSNDEPRPRLNKITEEGVRFQSHIDGSYQKLTPESSIKIQEALGADLIIAFDDLESPVYNLEQTKKSLELTNRWEVRSKKAQTRKDQLLYGVTHGGKFESLRRESAKFVNDNFDAIALGGAHSNKKNLYEVIEWTVGVLSENKPRHLLGIGEVDDIFEGVERGIDTFDCVIPTRLGRMGHVFVSPPIGTVANRFRYDITKSKFAKDKNPIDKNCKCYVCKSYSRAYINHLFRSRELLAYTLATYHNVYFINSLTNQIRSAILSKTFQTLKTKWI